MIAGADAVLDPAVLSSHTQAALGWPSPQMLAERAVEQAVISRAEVSVLPPAAASASACRSRPTYLARTAAS